MEAATAQRAELREMASAALRGVDALGAQIKSDRAEFSRGCGALRAKLDGLVDMADELADDAEEAVDWG